MYNQQIETISSFLDTKDIRVLFVSKLYSSSDGNFYIKTDKGDYFVKIVEKRKSLEILSGYKILSPYLNIPEVVKVFEGNLDSIILQKNINGKLASSLINNLDFNKKDLLDFENKKNKLLLKMYKGTKKTVLKKFSDIKCSKILWDRLFNERFDQFFGVDSKLNNLKDKKVFINNIEQKYNIGEIIDNLKIFFKSREPHKFVTVTGHGDGHRGNIILRGNGIFYIDTEYSDIELPMEVEMSKQMYNDTIGFLFFSQKELLLKLFSHPVLFFDKNNLYIEIEKCKKISFLAVLKKTKNQKLDIISQICSTGDFDFIFFKRLLLLCHLFTKNPNDYPNDIFAIFLLTLFLINEEGENFIDFL